MQRLFLAAVLVPLVLGCPSSAPLLGVVSPDAIGSRYLQLRNSSTGYVVFRVTSPGVAAITTPIMPPGGCLNYELLSTFGTLCPESLHIELAGYERLHAEVSPLVDMSVQQQPYVSVAFTMQPVIDYGCDADVSWLTIDSLIDCTVLELDPAAGAISFEAGWLPPQRKIGVQLADPPLPMLPEVFPLRGHVVNQLGEPMAGVEIRLPAMDASVLTDAEGEFSVALPQGFYLIEPVYGDVQFSPPVHTFSHASVDEMPIEFAAQAE